MHEVGRGADRVVAEVEDAPAEQHIGEGGSPSPTRNTEIRRDCIPCRARTHSGLAETSTMLAASLLVVALRMPAAPPRSGTVVMQQNNNPSTLAEELRRENARLAEELNQVQSDLGMSQPPPRAPMPYMPPQGMPPQGMPPMTSDPDQAPVDRTRLALAAGLFGAVGVAAFSGVELPSLPALPALPSFGDAVEEVAEVAAPVVPAVAKDPRAEAAMAKFFPGAMNSVDLDATLAKTLYDMGYTKANTLFAASTCPDEVNYKEGELIELMSKRWGEIFQLGGLGGVPFVGKAGFGAYAHHAAEVDGKMLIVFAPHVGVEYDGKVGALRRANQEEVSTACGAAIGAYNAIIKEQKVALESQGAKENEKRIKLELIEMAKSKGIELSELEAEVKAMETAVTPATPANGVTDFFSAQIAFIKGRLQSRMAGIEKAPDPIAFITYQMYDLTREFFVDQVATAPGLWVDAKELTVLGGIMINQGNGEDKFVPLMFQTRNEKPGTTIDLYETTFGQAPPDLSLPLGMDKAAAAKFHQYDLDTISANGK